MAILNAFALSTQINKNWDHVYVESDDGHSWGCFGGDSGGVSICSEAGDSAFAECLSHPQLQTIFGFIRYAGITYLADGVCHQAANRILYPANGITVASTRGYGISLGLYGTYGRNTKVPWPRLSHCANVRTGGGSGNQASGQAVLSTIRTKTAQFSDKIRQIYAAAQEHETDEAIIRGQELEAFASMRLGEDFDRGKIAAVAEQQRLLRAKHDQLVQQWERGRLKPDELRAKVRAAISEMASSCETILGPRDFERLFDMPAKDAPDLLNLF